MTAATLMHDLWRRAAGMAEIRDVELPGLDDLERSEWSERFVRLMRNRLVLGAFRYGRLHADGKRRYDRVDGAIARLEAYRKTGNLECLVDAANACLLEYEEGDHPRRHFGAGDDGMHFAERAGR